MAETIHVDDDFYAKLNSSGSSIDDARGRISTTPRDLNSARLENTLAAYSSTSKEHMRNSIDTHHKAIHGMTKIHDADEHTHKRVHGVGSAKGLSSRGINAQNLGLIKQLKDVVNRPEMGNTNQSGQTPRTENLGAYTPNTPVGTSVPTGPETGAPGGGNDAATNNLINQIINYLRQQKGVPGHNALTEGLATPSSGGADRLNKLAAKLNGAVPYVWGGGHGATPGMSQGVHDGGVADSFGDYAKIGLDCSGLTRYALYDAYGVTIPGTSQAQLAGGVPVNFSDLRKGDLIFPHPGHVQLYLGDGKILEAPQSGQMVHITNLSVGPGYQARRYISANQLQEA